MERFVLAPLLERVEYLPGSSVGASSDGLLWGRGQLKRRQDIIVAGDIVVKNKGPFVGGFVRRQQGEEPADRVPTVVLLWPHRACCVESQRRMGCDREATGENHAVVGLVRKLIPASDKTRV